VPPPLLEACVACRLLFPGLPRSGGQPVSRQRTRPTLLFVLSRSGKRGKGGRSVPCERCQLETCGSLQVTGWGSEN
jgi:hypothetical protein